jgi:hypothetical protein
LAALTSGSPFLCDDSTERAEPLPQARDVPSPFGGSPQCRDFPCFRLSGGLKSLPVMHRRSGKVRIQRWVKLYASPASTDRALYRPCVLRKLKMLCCGRQRTARAHSFVSFLSLCLARAVLVAILLALGGCKRSPDDATERRLGSAPAHFPTAHPSQKDRATAPPNEQPSLPPNSRQEFDVEALNMKEALRESVDAAAGYRAVNRGATTRRRSSVFRGCWNANPSML